MTFSVCLCGGGEPALPESAIKHDQTEWAGDFPFRRLSLRRISRSLSFEMRPSIGRAHLGHYFGYYYYSPSLEYLHYRGRAPLDELPVPIISPLKRDDK